MGLTSLLLGDKNPVSKYVADNKNTIRGAFAGFGTGRNFSEGLGRAALGANQGAVADDAYAITQAAEAKRQQQLMAAIEGMRKFNPKIADIVASGGMDPTAGWNKVFQDMNAKPTDTADTAAGRQILGQQFGLTGDELGMYVMTGQLPTGRGGPGEVSLQPTWMQDEQGNWVLGQMTKDRTVVQTQLPEGMTVAGPYEVAGQRTGGQVDAKTAATARAALPGAEQIINITRQAASTILSDKEGMAENFGNTLGVPNQMTPTWPGSPKADFWNNVGQAQGDAFLQARQWLKGQGAITETESAKAELALSKMEAAARSGSQDAFKTAVAEFQQAVEDGYQKLLAAAGGDYAAGNVPGLTASPDGVDYRTKYGLE